MERGKRVPKRRRERDRISDLPDDLLHCVLVHLQSAPAAARTSILSRRWRRVWADLPELVFGSEEDDVLGGLDPQCVDATLEAHSAPTVSSLDINVPDRCIHLVPSDSVDAWLRFASQRLTGTFSFTACNRCRCYRSPIGEINLPPCERATSIDLFLGETLLLFRPAGTFAALTELKIRSTFMEARELEALVSLHCPRLTDLTVITKVFVSDSDGSIRSSSLESFSVDVDVSIRSSSLKRLCFDLENARRLDVAAPMLEVLTTWTTYDAVYISAPKLAEVNVSSLHRYQFADTGRHLRRLSICESSVLRMRRFDTVDELTLQVDPAPDEYNTFLDDINNLPECGILMVSLSGYDHGFVPCMLRILRKANGIRKFVVLQICSVRKDPKCSLTCRCRLPESSNADITFGSLEEIELDHFFEEDDRLEFLELLLSRCSAPKLTSLKINMAFFYTVPSKKVVEKLRSICHPNVRLTVSPRVL